MSRKTYWALQWTWGVVMTAIGCLVAALLVQFVEPKPHKYGWYFVIGKGWGGVSLGPITIVSEGVTENTLDHEFGHSLQNCLYGPFAIILVCIPSVIRYWYRSAQKGKNLPPYDSAWFEGQATDWGGAFVCEE